MARTLSPATLFVAIVMVLVQVTRVVDAQASPPANTRPACALDGTSATIAFSTSGTNRVITTNFCPNHAIRTINPSVAQQNAYFGVQGSGYSVPLTPTLAPTAQIIDTKCIGGPIGFMRSGAVMYSVFPGAECTSTGDAVRSEGMSFDECGGHSDQLGMYHYHLTPTCTLTSAGATTGQHSPILGYMLDGIPVYGPLGANGTVPSDLDSCGGHASDGGNGGRYHYHTKPIKGTWPDAATPLSNADRTAAGAGYPYTPGCLRGCVPDTYTNFWRGRGSTVEQTSYTACVAAGTAQAQPEAIGVATPPASGSAATTTTTPPLGGTPTTSPRSGASSLTVGIVASMAAIVMVFVSL